LSRHIGSARHPISDVPVIYLLEPTAKNLEGITNDLQKGLYSPAYINFLSSIPRVLLEDFATQTATAGTSDQIAQLFDQYLNFIVAEPDLFSLGMQNEHTYWALNSGKTTDAELDGVVDRVVSGLFSVIVTMGTRLRHMGHATKLICHQESFQSSDVPKAQQPRWLQHDSIANCATIS
jgi:hypothetical protein